MAPVSKEYLRAWRKANPERTKKYAKKYARRNASTRLLRIYGITLDERDKMLAAQGGVCAGCGSADPASKLGWHVDHCHATKRVRGILCHSCNLALGHARDSKYILRGLIDYLEKEAA